MNIHTLLNPTAATPPSTVHSASGTAVATAADAVIDSDTSISTKVIVPDVVIADPPYDSAAAATAAVDDGNWPQSRSDQRSRSSNAGADAEVAAAAAAIFSASASATSPAASSSTSSMDPKSWFSLASQQHASEQIDDSSTPTDDPTPLQKSYYIFSRQSYELMHRYLAMSANPRHAALGHRRLSDSRPGYGKAPPGASHRLASPPPTPVFPTDDELSALPPAQQLTRRRWKRLQGNLQIIKNKPMYENLAWSSCDLTIVPQESWPAVFQECHISSNKVHRSLQKTFSLVKGRYQTRRSRAGFTFEEVARFFRMCSCQSGASSRSEEEQAAAVAAATSRLTSSVSSASSSDQNLVHDSGVKREGSSDDGSSFGAHPLTSPTQALTATSGSPSLSARRLSLKSDHHSPPLHRSAYAHHHHHEYYPARASPYGVPPRPSSYQPYSHPAYAPQHYRPYYPPPPPHHQHQPYVRPAAGSANMVPVYDSAEPDRYPYSPPGQYLPHYQQPHYHHHHRHPYQQPQPDGTDVSGSSREYSMQYPAAAVTAAPSTYPPPPHHHYPAPYDYPRSPHHAAGYYPQSYPPVGAPPSATPPSQWPGEHRSWSSGEALPPPPPPPPVAVLVAEPGARTSSPGRASSADSAH